MMRMTLAYGRRGLSVEVPDDAVVVRGRQLPALADEKGAVRQAVSRPLAVAPLRALARRGQRVVVVFPDQTRPMPSRIVLPPLLAELEAAGVEASAVTLICSTGSHRAPTAVELEELLGPALLECYEVVSHDGADAAHVVVGEVDGVPVGLDRRYVEADLRIVTGFVEPHVFAGFSGGPKAVCPGVASLETILVAHSPERIASSDATWLKTVGNPVHDFVRAACSLCPPSFSLDVTINSARKLTAVFAGDVWKAHAAARAFVERTVVQQLPERCDLVISTNGGYPLDRNLYQSVKGLAAAERVVRPGGTLTMAAECVDGLPPEGDFARILREAATVDALTDSRARPRLDFWSAQVLGRVVSGADVGLYSEGLSDEELAIAHVRRVDDISLEIAERLRERPRARVCVLPEGPLTVASTVE